MSAIPIYKPWPFEFQLYGGQSPDVFEPHCREVAKELASYLYTAVPASLWTELLLQLDSLDSIGVPVLPFMRKKHV